MDIETKELCDWLRENSSGSYRKSALAADLIERLTAEREQLMEPEPVAVMGNNGRTQAKSEFSDIDSFLKCCRNNTPLYAQAVPAQQVADPTNVWERAVIEAAEAVVRANQTNTGNEPSCSILARDIDALCEILNDNFLGYQPSPAVAVPDGWRLIPIEPTHEMIEAAHEKCGHIAEGFGSDHADHYRAMIAVAPEYNQSPRITEQDELDLRRYRWLRDSDNFPMDDIPDDSIWDHLCEKDRAEFDEFIDLMMVNAHAGADELLNKLNAKESTNEQ